MELLWSTIFVLIAACHNLGRAAPTFDVMKDLDAGKFSSARWWVTHRGGRLHEGHLDRCLVLSLSRRFNDQKLYVEIDHENSGAIDQAYFPASIDSTGLQFSMENGENVRIDIIHTDYESYTIGYLTLAKRSDEFLVLYANVPKPDGELLEKMKSKLLEITGVGVDALQIVDNDNCPEKVNKEP
ncbi:uncharacterized protein LOC100900171 [Galendromus occidentalis]|uniref:Uncharacterized protein LOC100900171 n=1 Tax=Galendromus occidentalis TaxID=34638 RepID=A0AAJ7SEP1_9ACAR|nr:uncharacterized protein LOC100900171 [Galendromus occidentalis]